MLYVWEHEFTSEHRVGVLSFYMLNGALHGNRNQNKERYLGGFTFERNGGRAHACS
jgi:hypothetical protein